MALLLALAAWSQMGVGVWRWNQLPPLHELWAEGRSAGRRVSHGGWCRIALPARADSHLAVAGEVAFECRCENCRGVLGPFWTRSWSLPYSNRRSP